MGTREVSFEFEVGRLICRYVREILESEQFYGRKIRFLEGKGFISRTFSIVGDEGDVCAVRSRLEHYMKCVDADA